MQSRKRSQYQQGKRNKNQPAPQQNKGKSQPTKKKCPGCDSKKHERKDCPHKEKICSFCKIKGHIKSACQKKKQKDNDGAANYDEKECQNAQIEYCSGTVLPTPPLYLWLSTPTGKHKVSSLSDTGASKSLINEQFAIQCGLKILPLAPTILRQAGGSTLPVCGFTTFDTTLNNVSTSIRAIVVSKLHKNLLISWQDLISLKSSTKTFLLKYKKCIPLNKIKSTLREYELSTDSRKL